MKIMMIRMMIMKIKLLPRMLIFIERKIDVTGFSLFHSLLGNKALNCQMIIV